VARPRGTFAQHALALAGGRRPPFALCYHGIGRETPATDPHGLMITPERFAAHLDALVTRGYRLVGVTELWQAVAHGGRAADGLGAITFDDGLADTLHLAADLLAARQATATAFLAPGMLGADHPDLAPGRRILRADEVPALETLGFEIGVHSYDHADLLPLPEPQQEADLRRSREFVEALVGHPVRIMAYPFGRYDAVTVRAARAAGFTIACTVAGCGPWDPLALPREPVFPSTTPGRVRVKAAGLYGPLRTLRAGTRLHRGRRP